VRVHQDVLRHVATRAAVKLPLNQVAAKKVNALLIKNKSDHRFYVRGRASKTGAAPFFILVRGAIKVPSGLILPASQIESPDLLASHLASRPRAR